MTKIHRAFSLDPEVDEMIKEFTKDYKFNASEWVNTKFKEEFMSVTGKEAQIAEHQAAILALESDIVATRTRMEALKNRLSKAEVRFLLAVQEKVRDGKTLTGLAWKFNDEFKRNFTQNEFEQTVRLVLESH